MKALPALLALGAVLALGAFAWLLAQRPGPEPLGAAGSAGLARDVRASEAARIEQLEARIDELRGDVDRLAGELVRARADGREDVGAPSPLPTTSAPTDARDASWYLAQYVASFQNGGEGSEYFRLAVQAFLPSLIDEVFGLIASRSGHPVLRRELVRLLGDPRLKLDPRVVSALVDRVGEGREDLVILAALEALRVVADARTAPALERVVWRIHSKPVRVECIRCILDLAGDAANRSILALLRTAPDEESRALLILLVSSADLAGALEVFRLASTDERATRLAAAHRVSEFRDAAFIELVADWLRRETDEEVRRVLGAAHEEQKRVPSYHPIKMTGAPDVDDPRRDHPNAWASQAPNGGTEWVELEYADPFRAHTLRVHEVLAAGAVARVYMIDSAGARTLVWEGVDSTSAPGAFEVGFGLTSFAVHRVRIELDTTRSSGWNEIDAVELIGPGRRAWASGARASTWYGAGRSADTRLVLPFDR